MRRPDGGDAAQALQFLDQHADTYAGRINLIVAPCVSPWGYERIQRWNPDAIDPNRSFLDKVDHFCVTKLGVDKSLEELHVQLGIEVASRLLIQTRYALAGEAQPLSILSARGHPQRELATLRRRH